MVEKTMQIMVSGKEGWETLHLSATFEMLFETPHSYNCKVEYISFFKSRE